MDNRVGLSHTPDSSNSIKIASQANIQAYTAFSNFRLL